MLVRAGELSGDVSRRRREISAGQVGPDALSQEADHHCQSVAKLHIIGDVELVFLFFSFLFH